MTQDQRNTILTLQRRGYAIVRIRRARGSVLLAYVQRRLKQELMPLRIQQDGQYICPWYDEHSTLMRRGAQWQTSQ